jgi:hypothetical protein
MVLSNWFLPICLGARWFDDSCHFPLGSRLCAIGPAEAPRLASSVSAELFSPGRVPGIGTMMPSSGEVLGNGTGTSSSSQIEGLQILHEHTWRGRSATHPKPS